MATDACRGVIAAGLALLGACQSEVQLPHAPPAPVVAIGALTTTVHIQPPEVTGPNGILSYTVVDSYGQHVFQANALETYSFPTAGELLGRDSVLSAAAETKWGLGPSSPNARIQTSPEEFSVEGLVSRIVAADFDGDGLADALSLGGSPELWIGLSDGGLAPEGAAPAPLGGTVVFVGDVTGDGFPDLVVDGALWVNSTDPIRHGFIGAPSALGAPWAMANLGGEWLGLSLQGGDLQIEQGSTAGFTTVLTEAVGATTVQGNFLRAVMLDMTGDGLPDFVVGTMMELEVYPNLGGLQFGPGFLFAGLDPNDSDDSDDYLEFTADVNQDGFPDLVGSASVLLGDGTGHFRRVSYFEGSNGLNVLGVADENDDGQLDLVTNQGIWLAVDGGGFASTPLGPAGVVGVAANFGPNGGRPALLQYYPSLSGHSSLALFTR